MIKPLLFFTLLFAVGSAASKTISSIDQLNNQEKPAVEWIKKWTVPNTRDKDGNVWTPDRLPKELTGWNGYKNTNIKPAAWAAGIVTAWSLSEQILECGDFYRASWTKPNGLIDTRCQCFKFPAKLPARTNGFPIEVFTYSLCKGKTTATGPDTKTGSYGSSCNCDFPSDPGEMIGPNQRCTGRAWQNGIFGMEQNLEVVNSAQKVATIAENIYHQVRGKGYTYVDVLDNTLTTAGFPKGTYEYENVMRCFPVKSGKRQYVRASDLSMPCADLVNMWLVRNHLVGLAVGMLDNLDTLHLRRDMVKVFATYFNK